MLCIWQQKNSTMLDENGDFDPRKAKIISRTAPARAGRTAQRCRSGKNARDMAKLTNAIQKFFIEHSRLRIPVIFHEECLHGHAAIDGTSFSQPIGLGATSIPNCVRHLFEMTARKPACAAPSALTPVVERGARTPWGRVEETFGEDPYLVAAWEWRL